MELARIVKLPGRVVAIAVAVVLALIAFARIPIATTAPQQAPEGTEVASSPADARRAPESTTVANFKAGLGGLLAQAAPPAPGAKIATQPQLARSGAIELLAPDVERALRDVTRAVHANGATVTGLSDERPANAGDVHRASVTVSVPQARFEQMLSALAGVARVRSRSIGAEDVGDKIIDDGARLRNLRRTETDLLKIMDRSGRVSEILDVEHELSSVREQVEQIDAELANTQRRVARAQIDVSVIEDSPVRLVEPEVGAQIAGAWRAALDQVKGFTLAAIARAFVIVAFAPYLVALLVAFLAVRVVVRARSRKAVAAAP